MPDVARLLADAPGPDLASQMKLVERATEVLRPRGAFARLDEVAAWLGAWQHTSRPTVESPSAIVFVADHGVTIEGVSAYPAAVTRAMLAALEGDAATAAVLARSLGVNLQVVDVGVGRPTANLATESALDPDRFDACFRSGRDAVASLDCDVLVLGEMGIGNTTAASAVCAGLFGLTPEDWTGRGTGIDQETLDRKVRVVAGAQARLKDVAPMEVLRGAGGAELAAMAGAALEARLRSIPLVLDGFVVTAALAPLEVAAPGALDNCIAGHCSSEPGHRLLLEKLGKKPLLDLDLRLGEGSGALLALPLVRAAAACVTEVATFEEWGLSGPR